MVFLRLGVVGKYDSFLNKAVHMFMCESDVRECMGKMEIDFHKFLE